MISFIIPTRDRPGSLSMTLGALGRLDGGALARAGGAEVIIADNASRFPPTPPESLANGTAVRVLLRPRNDGAAARNIAARAARGEWLVMLDDDSFPMDTGFIDELLEAPADVAAIGAEIFVPSRVAPDGAGHGRATVADGEGEPAGDIGPGADSRGPAGNHEAGGLPEVFIGCGVAIRRGVFLDPTLGDPSGSVFNGAGYDPGFHYYVEEYDLAARMILGGWRIVHSRGFRVMHHKVSGGRDMNVILRRLVRNNSWVEQRYAPEHLRRQAIQRVITRYRLIAEKEGATEGYQLGLLDLDDTLDDQPRLEMPVALYDRFTGLSAARSHLSSELGRLGARRVVVIDRGKNDWAVEQALRECGAEVVGQAEAKAVVIGTLSPGPMLDSARRMIAERRPVIGAWALGDARGLSRRAHSAPAA